MINSELLILHILGDCRRISAALSELPPRAVEENAALLILKYNVKFVNKYMGTLSPLPVEGDAVEHGIGNNQQAGRLQLKFHVVGNDSGKIVALILPALPVGNVRFHLLYPRSCFELGCYSDFLQHQQKYHWVKRRVVLYRRSLLIERDLK